MKVTAIALAAALAFPALAYEREPTPTSWRWLIEAGGIVGGIIGGINGAIDLWNKVNPPTPAPKPGDQFYCPPAQCSFGAVGAQLSETAYAAVTAFAFSLGKAWNPGDVLKVCNGFECVTVQWTGGMFIAMGPVEKDPRVGYANRPSSAGGGEGSASSGYTPSSTVWHPAVVYNPGSTWMLRQGTVTVIQNNTGGGGGGSGRFVGSLEMD
jgi:hypothetical protein